MLNNEWLVLLAYLLLLSGCKTESVKLPEKVKVYKYAGSVSCNQGSGTSLATMKQTLMNSKIAVISANCGNDGMVRPAVCGTETGNLNVFEVSSEMLPKVKALGFQPVSQLEDYSKVPCP